MKWRKVIYNKNAKEKSILILFDACAHKNNRKSQMETIKIVI